ncbi:unnamed protein product [Symbiodinium sp. CCMP2592]|nr:unnamed protein product [Symbiodinium sp. CCMP2592]
MPSGGDFGVAQGSNPRGHLGGRHGWSRRRACRPSPENDGELPGARRRGRACHRTPPRRVCDAGALAVGSENPADQATVPGLCRGQYGPPGLCRVERCRQQLGGRRGSEAGRVLHGRRGGTSSSTRRPEHRHLDTAPRTSSQHGSSVSGVGESGGAERSITAGASQSSAYRAFKERRRRRAQRAGVKGSKQGSFGISAGASGTTTGSVGRRAGPRSGNSSTGGASAEVGGGCGSRNFVGGRPDEACTVKDGAGYQKQKGPETSWAPQLRRQLGFGEGRGRAKLVFHQQGRPRDRSSRALESGDEDLSRCLFGADGSSHGQGGGVCRASANSAHVVREELPRRKVQDRGLLSARIRKCASSPVGEQTTTGPPPGLADDGSARAVPDRRELVGSFTADGHGGATLGSLGHAGLRSTEAAVRVQPTRRVHVDRGTHQRAQGGRVVDEKEVLHGCSEAKGQRGGKRRHRDREHRFLSWSAPGGPRRGAPLGEPHFKKGDGNSATAVLGPLEFLEDWCRFLESADLYRDPVPYPESGFVEGVMIDDHLGLQLLKRLPSMKRTLEQPARDQEVFASSASAYDYANLFPHPKKKQRRSLHVKAWGAELEGGRGLVGPARGRLLALSRLSAMSAKPGPMDQQILDGPRIPVPPWFWKLRRGDQAGALELDELQGPQLPRERDQLVRGRVTALTHKIRTNLLKDLTIWLQPRVPQYSLDELARTHIDVLCEWLEEFMIIMFLEHKSRRAASETLNALVQQYGWLRSSLAGPWNLIRTWEQLEPVQHHPPMPLMVVYALATTALLWRWPRMADLVLPGDHFDDEVLYVRIGQPKTRHRAAASQHVRVDHPGVAAWIVDALPSTPGWRRIWNGSWAAFKLRFDALQSEVLEGTPFLPSSLRPGGATFLFRSWDENLTRLQWRGRWKSFRMLETYVQELGATEVKVGTLLCLQCLAWEPKLGLSDRRGLDRSLYSFC